jgi:predicted N-acetyltransferase YhbS
MCCTTSCDLYSETVRVRAVAITRSKHSTDIAWLRRMAVSVKYQWKGITSMLVDEGLRSYKVREYCAVELVTLNAMMMRENFT